MFTGIVSGLGRVVQAGGGRLGVEHASTARRLEPGASVAVNGACLTVTKTEHDRFFFDVVAETLKRTNLGDLEPGALVNLELPLRLGQGLDGHLVLGHVDGVGVVTEPGPDLAVSLPPDLARYVAEKGSIAVDGVSLTVVEAGATSFSAALIPHTLENTVAQNYRRGTRVNLEVDVLARYLERLQQR